MRLRRVGTAVRQPTSRRNAASRCSVGDALEAERVAQAADREGGQHRGLGVGVHRRRGGAGRLGRRRAGSGAAAIDAVENWFMRASRRSFSNTSASPTITRVMPGFFSPNCSSTVSTLRTCVAASFAFADLVDEREDRALDELDQALEHLRLAGEVAVQRRFAHVEPGGQCGGGDAFGARLLEHGRQRLQDLDAALARLRTLARRAAAPRKIRCRTPHRTRRCRQEGPDAEGSVWLIAARATSSAKRFWHNVRWHGCR